MSGMPKEWHNWIDGTKVTLRYVQKMNQAPRFELLLDDQLVGDFPSIPSASKFAKREINKRKKIKNEEGF